MAVRKVFHWAVHWVCHLAGYWDAPKADHSAESWAAQLADCLVAHLAERMGASKVDSLVDWSAVPKVVHLAVPMDRYLVALMGGHWAEWMVYEWASH